VHQITSTKQRFNGGYLVLVHCYLTGLGYIKLQDVRRFIIGTKQVSLLVKDQQSELHVYSLTGKEIYSIGKIGDSFIDSLHEVSTPQMKLSVDIIEVVIPKISVGHLSQFSGEKLVVPNFCRFNIQTKLSQAKPKLIRINPIEFKI
jgi:hypothetical protein